jgi:hypothetical protein
MRGWPGLRDLEAGPAHGCLSARGELDCGGGRCLHQRAPARNKESGT